MSKSPLRALVTAALLLLPLSTFAAPTVTVVRSSIKVKPGYQPALVSSADLRAARNEFEAFQVVVNADASAGLPSVSVTKPVLTLTGSTETIPASEVRVYRVGTINLTQASNPEGGTGAWPDPVIPHIETVPALNVVSRNDIRSEVVQETRRAFPWSVPAGGRMIVWVDIHVPSSATPGVYTGTLRVTSTGFSGGGVNVPVSLRVWNFSIPSTSSLPTFFGFSPDMACRKHFGETSYCMSKDQVHKASALYARFMLQHRVSISLGDSSPDSPYSGAFNTFANTYAPLLDGTEPLAAFQNAKQLKSARSTSLRYPWYNDSDSSSTRVSKLQNWWNGVVTKGWQDVNFDYTLDEPGELHPWSELLPRAAEVHNVSPNFRTLVTTNIKKLNEQGASQYVNLLVPLNQHMDAKSSSDPLHGNQRSTYNTFRDSNPVNRVWGYQSCMAHGCGEGATSEQTNWPNLMVDTTGVQNRSEPWMHYIYGLEGLLYYQIAERFTSISTSSSTASPFDRANLYTYSGNGDGTLVYPGTPSDIGGTTHVPVASYRLKMLREGLEDYEFLQLCEDVSPATAKSIARKVFPMSGTTSSGLETGSMYGANRYPNSTPVADADRLESARDELAQCILGSSTPGGDRVFWHAGNFRSLPQVSGDLASFVDGLAHPNVGGYGRVSTTRTNSFNTFLDALFTAIDQSLVDGNTGDWCGVKALADDAGYTLQRFYDTGTGRWFIYGFDRTAFGQAYFFINPYAKRNLVIEAPHEGSETNTGSQGARLFTSLAARALIVNKEHRCSDPDATTCSGTTTACGGFYRESDVAHHAQNTFQLLHKRYSDEDPDTRFVQLHGMAGSASDVAEIADATTSDYNLQSVSVAFANNLAQYVPSASSVHSCQGYAGDPPSNNCASTNLQGRYTNAPAADACTTSTSSSSGRFVSVEQSASLRDEDDSDGLYWGDIRDALRDTWPTCDMNNGASDCTVGPTQTQYSDKACL